MPELPEVEVIRRDVLPLVVGKRILKVTIRRRDLRQLIPSELPARLKNNCARDVARRGKYLLFTYDSGTMILHFGMSGSLRITKGETPPEKHDHVDWALECGAVMRFRDARRFGLITWTSSDPFEHKLLKSLGPEPFSHFFNGDYLYEKSRNTQRSVKSFLMDASIVVGVGNIYASEALFASGINPFRRARNISRIRYARLAQAVQRVLQKALNAGGTTLRDFARTSGEPGYFFQQLQVYGREGKPCLLCARPVKCRRLLARSVFYCAHCQR